MQKGVTIKALTNSFVIITAVLHIFFFKLESIDFMKPEVLGRFGLDSSSGQHVKVWAFNQGFYNLFIALALIYGLYLINLKKFEIGKPLLSSLLLIVFGAGVVLYVSFPQKYVAALIQSLPAMIAFVSLNIYSRKLTDKASSAS